MALETKMAAPEVDATKHTTLKRRAPTLYLIILFKLGKGLLAGFLATVLYFQPATKLPSEYEQLMGRQWVKQTFHYLRIHPENDFFKRIAIRIADVTDAGVREAAIGALLWSLFPLTEGIGMLFRAGWAGWLAIGESAFFVPLEVHRLLGDFSWFMVGVTLTNIGIVWYLYANRECLFHHRHFRHKHD